MFGRTTIFILSVCLGMPAMAGPALTLATAPGSKTAIAGEFIVVQLHMSDLGTDPVAGFQAFIEFDDQRLAFVSGSYTSQPFGLAMISPIRADGDHIDLAAGINVFTGQPPTTDDAHLASLTFEALVDGCVVGVNFRPHDPPNRLTDPKGSELPGLILVDLPDEPPTSDLDASGDVDIADLLIMLAQWGDCPQLGVCAADLDCDGEVEVQDLLIMLSNWG